MEWPSELLEADPDVLGPALLEGAAIVAGGLCFRLREVEIYRNEPGHEDPYTHGHPEQAASGTWYLHRVGRGFRGGSFKGLDLTCARRGGHGGALIRSLEGAGLDRSGLDRSGLARPGLICGPSRCVDALLRAAGFDTVSSLHEALGGRPATQEGSALRLVQAPPTGRVALRSARVGLGLGRLAAEPRLADWVDRRLRYLDAPREIPQGRALLARALAEDGLDPEAICAVMGARPAAVDRWLRSRTRPA